MLKTCTECGAEFEARRRDQCGDRCKKRAQRRPKSSDEPAPVREMPTQAPTDSVEEATRDELARAGREDTAVGQSAVALARRIDAGASEPGSSFAALVREHRGVLAEALKDAETAADPLDELRAKREQRLAG